MTDQQRHREAVERYIADSQGRIAGQKLCIADLEAQGENSLILGKSLHRAEKSLAMMMAYRDGLVPGGRRCVEPAVPLLTKSDWRVAPRGDPRSSREGLPPVIDVMP